MKRVQLAKEAAKDVDLKNTARTYSFAPMCQRTGTIPAVCFQHVVSLTEFKYV